MAGIVAGDWWAQNAPPGSFGFGSNEGNIPPGAFADQPTQLPPINPGVLNPQGPIYQPTGGIIAPGQYGPGDLQQAPSGGTPTDPGGPVNGDYQGWFQKLVAGKPYNQQTLLDLEPILQKYGIQLTPPNAAGERTKINIPGVGWVRVGFGEGRPVWIPQGAGPGGGPSVGGGANPSAGRFSPVDPYQAPNFVPPTGLDFINDPGYKARMQMGADAIENSAAARGGILSGGTLKALERYGQDFGTNEFGNVFNRGLQTAGYNAGVGQMGYGNRYGQYQDWQNWMQRNQDRGAAAAQGGYRPPPS